MRRAISYVTLFDSVLQYIYGNITSTEDCAGVLWARGFCGRGKLSMERGWWGEESGIPRCDECCLRGTKSRGW